MANITPLGEAPSTLAHAFEPPMLWIEDGPLAGTFSICDARLKSFRVLFGANDQPTCEVSLAIGRPQSVPYPNGPSYDPGPRDWQVWVSSQGGGGSYRNPEAVFGTGVRVQIKTMRDQPSTNWCIFEGFVERVQRGWDADANGEVRWLRLYCVNTAAAADRMLSQFMVGQWRRSYKSGKALYVDLLPETDSLTRECVRVGSEPAVFNPGGFYNCHPTPLKFNSENPNGIVHVFCDTDHKRRTWPPYVGESAEPWTVARILRYLQWSALQPELVQPGTNNPEVYDRPQYSSVTSPTSTSWIPELRIAHHRDNYQTAETGSNRLQVGPNLSDLVEPYLLRTDAGDPTDPQAQAMLRRPSDLVVDRMTIMEAFAHVCDIAGLVFSVEHDIDTSGNAWTYLRFTVRGDRDLHGGIGGGEDTPGGTTPGSGSQSDGAIGNPGFRDASGTRKTTARGVYLYCSTDKLDNPAGNTPESFAIAAVRRDSSFKGMLTQEHSGQRRKTLVLGDATQYEVTLQLLPGWSTNSNWDINPADSAAVQAAIDYIASQAWTLTYGPVRVDYASKNVGRWWVLNEDGFFESSQYKRAFGPWNEDAHWLPFKWQSAGGIFELATRGDEYWAARRRRFLPIIARDGRDGRWLEPVVRLSFDSGASWYDGPATGLKVQVDSERCAVYITNEDLRQVRHPSTTQSYVDAYIRGTLRLQVIANVEGDDALMAWSPADQTWSTPLPWAEVIDRRGQAPRNLRFRPGSTTIPASSTDALINEFSAVVRGDNDDRQEECNRLASRVSLELGVPRVGGQVTIPWLWRNLRGPGIVGYRVGDEVIGLQTADLATQWTFGAGRDPRLPAPRIIGIVYTYNETDMSTSLTVEDHGVGMQDLIGSPEVLGPNPRRPVNRNQEGRA